MRVIKNDLFGISQRLKKINTNYALFFNDKLKRFEVHTSCTPNSFSLCFIVPNLDVRAIYHANQTRIENIDKITNEIEINNNKIKQKPLEAFKATSAQKLADFMQYASVKECAVDFKCGAGWL